MRLKYFITILFTGIIFINNIFAQQKDTANFHAVYHVVLKQENGSLLVQDTCDLFYSDKKSWFTGRNTNNMLLALQQKLMSSPSGASNFEHTDFAGTNKPLPFSILKNYETNDVVILEEIEGQWLGYKDEEAKKRQWKITEEKDSVQNLLCTKATIEDSGLLVWFSPDIPINEGPLRGFGLPGLTVKYQSSKGWEAILLSVNYNSNTPFQAPQNITITTQEKIRQTKKAANQKILIRNGDVKIELRKVEN